MLFGDISSHLANNLNINKQIFFPVQLFLCETKKLVLKYAANQTTPLNVWVIINETSQHYHLNKRMKLKVYMFPCTVTILLNLTIATLIFAYRGICEITSDLTSSNFVSFLLFPLYWNSSIINLYAAKPTISLNIGN